MARSRCVRSLNERPRRSATPYSVTTMSASPRGVVTGRPSSEATMRECLPSGVVDGSAMIERPPGDANAPRTKSS